MVGQEIANLYLDKVNAFLQLVEAMPPDVRESRDFIGAWSVREILSHLTYWDANNVWILESEALGHPYTLDEGDVDARNANAIAAYRDMSWPELVNVVATRRNYRAMLHLRPSALDYSGAGEHWDEHREEIVEKLRNGQKPIGANVLTPGQISAQYEARSGCVVDIVSILPEDRRTDSGVCGDWSMKDLMGHLAFWDSTTIDSLTAELSGSDWSPDPRSDDEINSIEAAKRVDWTWDQVMAEVVANRNRRILLHLMPAVTNLSDVGSHWVEHGAQIDVWVAEHIGGE